MLNKINLYDYCRDCM